MIGHVLPFFPEYDWALGLVRSGEFGPLRGGAFRRVIAEPKWNKNFWSPEEIGGPMLDLHVHDAHFIRLLFGMPQEVVSCGSTRGGVPEFWHSQFRFANRDLVVAATCGTIPQQGRPFTHGFEIHLEKATLAFDFAVIGGAGQYLCKPTLFDDAGGVQHPESIGWRPHRCLCQRASRGHRQRSREQSVGNPRRKPRSRCDPPVRSAIGQLENGKARLAFVTEPRRLGYIAQPSRLGTPTESSGNCGVPQFVASAYNPLMALLIDGYNLLNVTGIFGDAGPGTALHRTRLAFLNFLASSFTKRQRSQTTIVFDAAARRPVCRKPSRTMA